MKEKSIVFVIFILIAPLLYSQEKSPSTIYLSNPLNLERIDETFIITRNEFKAAKSTLVPIIINMEGDTIPTQLDDINGDNNWDELSFEYTLKKYENVILNIKWVSPKMYPVFPLRTNVRYGKMISPGNIQELAFDFRTNKDTVRGKGYPYQMDGIAWENDKMGFRHYFDGRNDRDVFGKRVSTMALDTVGIDSKGYPANTYQVPAKWGRDILNVGNSFGLGGLAMMSSDTIIQLGDIETGLADNVDSTYYRLIIEGPVRSVFRIEHKGWHVGNRKVNLTQDITIWGGKHYYQNKVKADNLPSGFNLVTGIVRNQNNKPLEKSNNKLFASMMTHDKQTTDPQTFMGMALIISNSNLISTFDTPNTGHGILSTWCAKLCLDRENQLYFDVYAGWDQQDNRFGDRKYFFDFINKEMDKKSNPIEMKLK